MEEGSGLEDLLPLVCCLGIYQRFQSIIKSQLSFHI